MTTENNANQIEVILETEFAIVTAQNFAESFSAKMNPETGALVEDRTGVVDTAGNFYTISVGEEKKSDTLRSGHAIAVAFPVDENAPQTKGMSMQLYLAIMAHRCLTLNGKEPAPELMEAHDYILEAIHSLDMLEANKKD